MEIISAYRINALKAAVKAECLRRSGKGSVESYGGSAYDFTATPADGIEVLTEHYSKVIVPLNAITGSEDLRAGRIVSEDEIAAAEARVAALAKIKKNAAEGNTGCAVSCTGLCAGSCTSGCSGCGSDCSNNCSSCTGGCEGTCKGCGSGCASECVSGCTDDCKGCGSGCWGYCSTTCVIVCGNAGCEFSCMGYCTKACDGSCSQACGTCGTNCTAVSK